MKIHPGRMIWRLETFAGKVLLNRGMLSSHHFATSWDKKEIIKLILMKEQIQGLLAKVVLFLL